MMNNQSLKATLAQKAAEIQPTARPIQTRDLPTAIPAVAPVTVAITINVPLAEAARYLERLQAISIMQSPAVSSTVVPPTIPTSSSPAIDQTARQPKIDSLDRLSDKQKSMILNLSKRKKVAAEQMEAILRDRFGVDDGTLLSKRQASQLIDLLMAQ